MHILEPTKPYRRHLTLYSSRPIAPGGSARGPFRRPREQHAQPVPPHGTRDRLKVAAGAEAGAGMFATDVRPKTIGCQLQQLAVDLEFA